MSRTLLEECHAVLSNISRENRAVPKLPSQFGSRHLARFQKIHVKAPQRKKFLQLLEVILAERHKKHPHPIDETSLKNTRTAVRCTVGSIGSHQMLGVVRAMLTVKNQSYFCFHGQGVTGRIQQTSVFISTGKSRVHTSFSGTR